jgi:tetratricopeptide (TPR) repeat protein
LTELAGCPQTAGMAIVRSNKTTGLILTALLALGCGSSKPAESPAGAPSAEASTEPDLAEQGEGSTEGFGPGVDAISAGDFEKARSVFAGIVADEPSNAKAHFYLGVAQQNLGQAEAAVASYEKALSLEPKLTEASVNLTAALLDAGDAGKAAPIIERALARDPGNAGLLYNRALAASMLGKTTEAVKAYREAVAADPSNAEIRYGYAEALVAAGSNSQAKSVLTELTQSNDVAVLASSARLLGRLEEFDACIEALGKALAREASAELYVARGLCQHGKKNDKAAFEDFQKGVEKDPGYAPAHYYAGMDLKARGKKADAKKALARAVDLGGDSGIGKAAKRALESL